jgi:hypothetical protein
MTTDQVPSKDLTLAEALELVRKHEQWFKERDVPSVSRTLVREIERLQRENDTCGLECSEGLNRLAAENERLRTTLSGIASCASCEMCRGAANRALGEKS